MSENEKKLKEKSLAEEELEKVSGGVKNVSERQEKSPASPDNPNPGNGPILG